MKRSLGYLRKLDPGHSLPFAPPSSETKFLSEKRNNNNETCCQKPHNFVVVTLGLKPVCLSLRLPHPHQSRILAAVHHLFSCRPKLQDGFFLPRKQLHGEP